MVKLEKILIGTFVAGLTLGFVYLAKLTNNSDSFLYTDLTAGGFALSMVSAYILTIMPKLKNQRENQEAVQNNSEVYAS